MSISLSARRWLLLGIALTMVCAVGVASALQDSTTEQFHVFNLQHQQAKDIEESLRPLLPTSDKVQIIVDEANNRILVSGDDATKRIVTRFLAAVDIPKPNDTPQVDDLEIYRVPVEVHDAIVTNLTRVLVPQGAKVQEGPQKGTIFVIGTRSQHEDAAAMIERFTVQLAPERNPLVQPDEGQRQDAELTRTADWDHQYVTRFVPLRELVRGSTQREILILFENRLVVDPNAAGQSFVIDLGEAGVLRFEFDTDRSGVMVNGRDDLVEQFRRLLHALSDTEIDQATRSQVIRLKRENQGRLNEAIQGNGQAPQSRPQNNPNSPNDRSGYEPRPNEQGLVEPYQANANPYQIPARVASTRQDIPENNNRVGQDEQDPNQDEQNGPNDGTPQIRQFEGIEIDSLPDLDVIILRGRDEEIEQLADIIRQLELISQENQAEIRIVALSHTASERVAALVDQASDDLLGSRQGRVQVTPLVKPNSLMLIGWGDALTTTIQLIRTLDVPVAPETQFKVFALRHASASDVESTVQSFLSGRSGLGPEIVATVDARTNSILVFAAPRDLAELGAIIARLDTPRTERVAQARILAVRNSFAQDVADTLTDAISAATLGGETAALELLLPEADGTSLLRSGILENVQVTVNARNNTLIVSAPEQSFELIEALVTAIDSPGTTAKIKIFPVVNGDASALVQTLRSLIPSQGGGTALPQLSSAPQETSLAPLRFTVDARSNSILATGSEGDLRIVEALILRLDEDGGMQRQNTVYQLKNAPATDVALAVNEFLRNKRIVEAATPGEINPFQQIEKEVVVVPEPVSNKLILSATPRYFQEVEELIERLDEQPPEVLIQVLIAEVTLNNADEFGVELGLQDSVLFDRSLLGDLVTTTNTTQISTAGGVTTLTEELIRAATNNPGFNFNSNSPLGNSGSDNSLNGSGDVGSQGISNFGVSRLNNELGFGGLVLSASSQNVSVLVRALQESRRLEILSRPQIRTLDNQSAFIQVGQRVPRIIGSTVGQNGQQNTVALENVGLILAVTPRISPDGNVVMEIDAEKSELGPEQEGVPVSVALDGTVIRSPRVDTATAQASVSAASGETIVLGGLITKSSAEVHRKVPFLGDLPIVNPLFRFDSMIERRTELLIILTPQVIRSREDSERIKQTEIARMSWCAADVYNIHGDINYVLPDETFLQDGAATDVIYPDVDPRGESNRRPQELADREMGDVREMPLRAPLRGRPEPFDDRVEQSLLPPAEVNR